MGGYNYLMSKFEGDKLSPSGRTDFTSSAVLQAVLSRVITASRPGALHMKQNRFVKYPG